MENSDRSKAAEAVGGNTSPQHFPLLQNHEVWKDVYRRLVENQNEAANYPAFAEQLQVHFNRFPPRTSCPLLLDKPVNRIGEMSGLGLLKVIQAVAQVHYGRIHPSIALGLMLWVPVVGLHGC